MRERIQRFMIGRYGIDDLGKCMLGAILVCLVLSIFFRRGPWYLLAMGLLVICYIRMFSRSTQRRYEENQKFLKATAKLRGWWSKEKSYMAQRKTHHIYSCPSCKQKIRIPRGKGKISIRCPKCGREFIKRS